jgi:hypothetical protein
MPQPPPTRYAQSGENGIAYRVTGDGPFDLLMAPGSVSHPDRSREEPAVARQLQRLASLCRLIRFDKRGVFARMRIPGTRPLFKVD